MLHFVLPSPLFRPGTRRLGWGQGCRLREQLKCLLKVLKVLKVLKDTRPRSKKRNLRSPRDLRRRCGVRRGVGRDEAESGPPTVAPTVVGTVWCHREGAAEVLEGVDHRVLSCNVFVYSGVYWYHDSLLVSRDATSSRECWLRTCRFYSSDLAPTSSNARIVFTYICTCPWLREERRRHPHWSRLLR